MSNPKLSVIVPIYNTEQYLPRCIDSILIQSFTDFELLLIDDGSMDGSGKICDEYAQKDSRIRVFHKENGGASSARNLGLRNMRGQYVTFVDSDDWVKEQYFEHLMFDESELVVSGLQEFGLFDTLIIPKDFNEVSVCKLLDNWTYSADYQLYIYICAKRFKASVIRENRLLFNENLFYSEDFCFVMDYLACINKVIEMPFAEYQYGIIDASRNEKYMMSAQQLIDHYEAHVRCFDNLGTSYSLKAVRKDMNIRLFGKFCIWLSNCDKLITYRSNSFLFREQQWANELLGQITGKKSKRIGYGAYYCPVVSFFIERLAFFFRKVKKAI